MKFLDKTALVIFSDIVLILSIIACVLVFGWVDFDTASNLVHKAIADPMVSKIILACSIVFILLAIKSIFFTSTDKEGSFKQGILLENEEGKLMISKETFQNLANSVVMKFEAAEDVYTTVHLDKENNIIINIDLTVKPKVVIKELSTDIQNKIKETIKTTADLDVKQVNIKVKNIAPKQKESNK